MKNLKKLFVVLPLVLVMLLSIVPVQAEEFTVDSDYVENTLFQGLVGQTKVTKDDVVKYLSAKGTLRPVWVGENIPFANSNFPATTDGKNKVNDRHMNVVLMNGGAVHGWISTNYDAVAPLGVAQNYVAANLPGYVIPSYQIQNVMHFTKNVRVPETWLKEEYQPTKQVIDPDTAKVIYVNAKFTDAVKNGDDVIYAKDSAVPADMIPANVTWKHDANNKTATAMIKIQVPSKVQDGDAVEAEVKVIADIAYTGETETVPAPDKNKLVDAKITGLLIIVEKADIDVAVTHHFVFADGTEIVQTANQKWAKANGALTVATVNPAWYMAVPGFTIDTTKTAVAEVRDEANYLVLGEKVLKSYKVDLYYTAGEGADKANVDAAFAGNTANVANAQQLPATGAADSFALVLSSLALVVVGLFLKK
ncbi:MAG: hypothetical protein SPK23_00790 [Eubacteriales bacterium]|nr:hypothetical protein [Clostridiales bacterium]MDY5835652.1 hypothetical protein [Eubacteriales bacterium]